MYLPFVAILSTGCNKHKCNESATLIFVIITKIDIGVLGGMMLDTIGVDTLSDLFLTINKGDTLDTSGYEIFILIVNKG